MDEAIAMMAQETGYIILDVRRPDEFAEGHIPNAINVANEIIGTDEIPELPDRDHSFMLLPQGGIVPPHIWQRVRRFAPPSALNPVV